MRKTGTVLLLVAALLLAAGPAHARSRGGWHGGGSHSWHGSHGSHGGGRVFIGVGPGFWWGPYPYWYYPPPYYVSPPSVIVQDPPVYIQQEPPVAPPPPGSYWYYCPSARAYYPDVPSCPEAWIRVAPRPAP